MSQARLAATTINNYIKGEVVNVFRRRRLLAVLMKKKLISYNENGILLDWKVRFKRAPLTAIGPYSSATFTNRNRWKTAQLPYRAYIATDAMTKMERLQNRGPAAIVNVYKQIARDLMDDIKDNFAEELYIDGNATGNTDRIHGLESCLAASGTSNYINTSNDTYAGHSTVLGTSGGSWTGTWPQGYGDAHYDWWTPLLVDTDNTADFGAGSTWANSATDMLRFGIVHGQRNDVDLDMVLMDQTSYFDFLNLLETKERIQVERNPESSILVSLGFGDVVNFDGVDCTWEQGIASGTRYGIDYDSLELCSLQKDLFVADAEDYDIESRTYRWSADFFGNMKMNPRHLVKWAN